MDSMQLRRHRTLNRLQSLALLLAMAALLGAIGYLIGGFWWLLAAVAALLLVYFRNPLLSPRLLLGMYRVQPLAFEQAPRLYQVLAELCRRAELPHVPQLYYLPSSLINAFATGDRDEAAIVLSDGLLRRLGLREVAAVLAHEVSHIGYNDLRTMAFADAISRLTTLMAIFGQLLLLLNLPLILLTDYGISWIAIALLLLAPTISALLQLALSRSREYGADLGAARLLGDPVALASALQTMESYQGRVFERWLLPGRRSPEPSLLRTHPPTEERVRRLLALQRRDRREWGGWQEIELPGQSHGYRLRGRLERPRRRWLGR